MTFLNNMFVVVMTVVPKSALPIGYLSFLCAVGLGIAVAWLLLKPPAVYQSLRLNFISFALLMLSISILHLGLQALLGIGLAETSRLSLFLVLLCLVIPAWTLFVWGMTSRKTIHETALKKVLKEPAVLTGFIIGALLVFVSALHYFAIGFVSVTLLQICLGAVLLYLVAGAGWMLYWFFNIADELLKSEFKCLLAGLCLWLLLIVLASGCLITNISTPLLFSLLSQSAQVILVGAVLFSVLRGKFFSLNIPFSKQLTLLATAFYFVAGYLIFKSSILTLSSELAQNYQAWLLATYLFIGVPMVSYLSILFKNNLEPSELSEFKKLFIQSVDHELSTSIHNIRPFIQLIKVPIPDIVKEELEVISNNSEVAGLKLKKLTWVARITSGFGKNIEVDFALSRFIEYLEKIVKTYVNATLHFKLECDDALKNTCFFGDCLALLESSEYLLENAFKFSKPREESMPKTALSGAVAPMTVTLKIWEDTEQEKLYVRVINDGKIDTDKINLMFRLFRQGSEGHTKKAGGFGFGLSLVQHFLWQHSERVRLYILEDSKTAFEFCLPMKRSAKTVLDLAKLGNDMFYKAGGM